MAKHRSGPGRRAFVTRPRRDPGRARATGALVTGGVLVCGAAVAMGVVVQRTALDRGQATYRVALTPSAGPGSSAPERRTEPSPGAARNADDAGPEPLGPAVVGPAVSTAAPVDTAVAAAPKRTERRPAPVPAVRLVTAVPVTRAPAAAVAVIAAPAQPASTPAASTPAPPTPAAPSYRPRPYLPRVVTAVVVEPVQDSGRHHDRSSHDADCDA